MADALRCRRLWIVNLAEVAPGKMIGGTIYKNRNGHLSKAEGRIWYEALPDADNILSVWK